MQEGLEARAGVEVLQFRLLLWKSEALANFADREVRTELVQGATLMSFTAFCQEQKQGKLS